MDVITIKKPASREFYLVYLNSSDWRARRKRALQAADFCCQTCGAKRGLEVHHLTYERLGREWDQDLKVLCDDCHVGEHVSAAEGTSLELYLKIARQAVYAEPFLSYADLKGDVIALCLQHKIALDHRSIEKAMGLVMGRQPMAARRSSSERFPASSEPLSYALPCSCAACIAAGVSDRRLRRDRPTSEWLHGEDLRRWYAARDQFRGGARTAAGERGRHAVGFEALVGSGAPSAPRTKPTIDIYGPPPRTDWGEHDRY